MALQLIENIITDLDEQKTKPTVQDRFAVRPLRIDGLCAAVFTPFDEKQNVNIAAIAQQAAYLHATGVKAVFVGGTTGEGVSCTMDERKRILKQWMDLAPRYRFTVIFNCGCNVTCNLHHVLYSELNSMRHMHAKYCVRDACNLAVYAETVGVDAVAVLPPSYFQPLTIESLVMSVKQIADAVPLLPVYYYHVPSRTNVRLSMHDFLTAADETIPNLIGIKNSGMHEELSFSDIMKIVQYKKGERFEVLTGQSELILPCLSIGVVGFVSSQYSFAGKLYNAIIKAYRNGNMKEAQELSLYAVKLADLQRNGICQNKHAAKYVMSLLDVDVGEARLPFLPLSQIERELIGESLQRWCDETQHAYISYKSTK